MDEIAGAVGADGSPMTDEDLTVGQRAALSDLMAGRNVFLSGDAGTGKSLLLRHFIAKAKAAGRNVIACAPTGIAALNLPDGSTVHRAFKLKFRPVYRKADFTKPTKAVAAADVIVIDEISMCRIDLFHHVCKTIRAAEKGRGRPVQVVAVGDFLQLPPVVRGEERTLLEAEFPGMRDGFAFEDAESWGGFGFVPHVLTEVKRQSGDGENAKFKEMLTRARHADPSCIEYFNGRVGADVGQSIRIVPTNNKASVYNDKKVTSLKARSHEYRASSSGDVKASDKAADDVLSLAPGARVICLVNDQLGAYQNGSMGEVRKCGKNWVDVLLDDTGELVRIERHEWEMLAPADDGKGGVRFDVVGRFNQIPLKLAYAITIHKSQGQTMKRVTVDPAAFAPGQLYVALSRCESIGGLSLTHPIREGALMSSEAAAEFYAGIESVPPPAREQPPRDVPGLHDALSGLLDSMRERNLMGERAYGDMRGRIG